MVNENNYVSANVTVVGLAGGEWEVRELGNSGYQQAELSIAVSKGYKNKETDEWVDKGTDWYKLTATPNYAEENWPEVGKGDRVRVEDARLEARPYTKNNGEAAVELRLQYGELTVVSAKEPVDVSNGFV